MVMAEYSEFNNNNYLSGPPSIHGEMTTTTFYPATTQFRTPSVPQSGFTFTSPTQCSTLATHRPCIQATSRISNLSAPGVGTSWQHSIPLTMPWMDIKSPVSQQQGVSTATVFTGVPQQSYFQPQTSCSIPYRWPKRKALDLLDDAPVSKVYLCADQFANMRISPNDQQNINFPANDAGSRVQFYAHGIKSKTDTESWQHFRELESRLDFELDDDTDVKLASLSKTEEGPLLKVAEGVLEAATAGSPILPRKVMENITKPCMQIVLWKSPGELIRDVTKEEKETTVISSATDSLFTTSIVDSKFSTAGTRFPLTSRDNIMDMTPDMTMLDGPLNSFQTQPQYATSSCNLSMTNLDSASLSSNKGTLSSSCLGINRVSTSNSGGIIGDLDMFDSMDDDMQL